MYEQQQQAVPSPQQQGPGCPDAATAGGAIRDRMEQLATRLRGLNYAVHQAQVNVGMVEGGAQGEGQSLASSAAPPVMRSLEDAEGQVGQLENQVSELISAL